MTAEAIRLQIHEARTATAPHLGDQVAEVRIRGEHVLTVHCASRDPVRYWLGGHVRLGDSAERGPHSVLVVLDHVDCRKLPHGGHVQRLVESALVHGRVAHVDDDDRVFVAVPDLPSDAGRERHLAADDAVAAHESARLVVDVHRPAPAAGRPVDPTEQLGHHRVRVHTLGDRLRVVAVRGDDVVVFAQRLDAARGRTFLPDVHVAKTADLADRVRLFGFFFETPIEQHVPQQVEGQLGAHAIFAQHVPLLPARLLGLGLCHFRNPRPAGWDGRARAERGPAASPRAPGCRLPSPTGSCPVPQPPPHALALWRDSWSARAARTRRA